MTRQDFSDELLNQPESETILLLAQAWNTFLSLESLHDDDIPEFRRAIHEAQRIVMSRPVQRQLNQEIQP